MQARRVCVRVNAHGRVWECVYVCRCMVVCVHMSIRDFKGKNAASIHITS